MAKTTKERRKQPRAKGTAGMKVGVEPQIPAVQVRDISLSGISFRVDDPIEFMTRLMMTLIFPTEPASPAGRATPLSVQCEGAVVRCDPVTKGGKKQYEVAVFFTQLDNPTKEAIEEYVQTH